MNRRAVFAMAPAAMFASRSSALWDPVSSPIMHLFKEWRHLSVAARKHICIETDEDAELDRLYYDQLTRIESEIMALPSTSAADFACKVIIDTCEGELFSDWETGALWQEARALTGGSALMVMP